MQARLKSRLLHRTLKNNRINPGMQVTGVVAHQEGRNKLEFDKSCSGCADAMTDILNYKAMALRNFERKKERIDSRIDLLGRLSKIKITVALGVTNMF